MAFTLGVLIIIAAVVFLFAGKIFTFLIRFAFFALLIGFVLTFAFDVSMNQVIDWVASIVLLVL
jgi:hypothetical protein